MTKNQLENLLNKSDEILSLAKYLHINKKLEDSFKKTQSDFIPIKIALIATYSITGLAEVIRVMCWQIGIKADIYTIPYAQYFQQIFDETSFLYQFQPEIIFFLPDAVSLLSFLKDINQDRPALLEKKAQTFIYQILQTIQKRSQALLVTSLLPENPDHVLANLAVIYPQSQIKMIKSLNKFLIDLAIKCKRKLIYDINAFFMRHGWDKAHNQKMYLLADYYISPDYLPFLGYDLTGFIKSIKGKSKKCIVVDLDNTLWGGIVGEDGVAGIALGPNPPGNAYYQFQRTLLTYYQRGILLAVNSNNNPADIEEVWQKHPHILLKSQHFASIVINWEDKVSNLKKIAQEVNLGLDSLVFVDDDPKKRLMIKHMLPQVKVVELPTDPAYYTQTLLRLNDFYQLAITDEDLKRGERYYQQTQRIKFKTEVTNLDQYLKNLHVNVIITKANIISLPRIEQLTARTNQFNLTTRRYTQIDIQKFMIDPKSAVYTAEVTDRFGNYGICGVVILRQRDKSTCHIDTFLLSCRVLGLGVEFGLIYQIAKNAKYKGYQYLLGEYLPTLKSKPAANFYAQAGFASFTKDKRWWKYNLQQLPRLPKHLNIKYEN